MYGGLQGGQLEGGLPWCLGGLPWWGGLPWPPPEQEPGEGLEPEPPPLPGAGYHGRPGPCPPPPPGAGGGQLLDASVPGRTTAANIIRRTRTEAAEVVAIAPAQCKLSTAMGDARDGPCTLLATPLIEERVTAGRAIK